jgi:hypothetical protein
MKILFIINGQEVPTVVNVNYPLGVARNCALENSAEDIGRPFDEWEVRSQAGVLLDPAVRLGDFGLAWGVKLFITLRVVAGCETGRRASENDPEKGEMFPEPDRHGVASDPGYPSGEEMVECRRPCHPDVGCAECAGYWQRMINEGFWDREKCEWTDRGMREMTK